MLHKRYPGVRPFETTDKDLFFGRERDIQDLSVLIALEKLTVLFGKSGYGKSSLINAGIIPYLDQTAANDESPLLPLVVRLGSYTAGSSLSPVDNLLARLHEKIPGAANPHFLNDLLPERTLWYHFKRRSLGAASAAGNPGVPAPGIPDAPKTKDGGARFLLIFDQFEEFFTYPTVQQDAFKSQLAELLYTEMPQAVRDAVTNLDKNQRRMLAEPLDVKVLFAVRSDRLSQLDGMKDKLPAILHKRFELKGLSEQQAIAAIEKPAALAAPEGAETAYFASPVFQYSPQALRLMVEKLGETKQGDQRTGIEAFQLQILCEYLEGEVMDGRVPGNCVEPVHFAGKIDAIYEGYYQRLLDKLPAGVAKSAQRLIEDALIFQDDKTGESRRLSVDAGALAQRYAHAGVTHDTLRQLENTFLLRREANSMGGFSYELSHDTLLAPILKMKTEREAAEAAEAERRAARKRQRRLLAILVALTLALTGVTGVVVYVLKLKDDADAALLIAKQERVRAEEATVAAETQLNNYLKAVKDREKIEFENTLRKVEQILEGPNCPSKEQRQIIADNQAKYADDPQLQQRIRAIQAQLARCP